METTHQFPETTGGPSNVSIQGKVYHRCIEFQKRGLPHVHILIRYRIPCNTPALIDSVISACLPEDPGDRELIKKFMIHRHPKPDQPASKYCQREGSDGSRKCRFHYPQTLQPTTTIDAEGRVHYMRLHEEDRMVVPYCLPLIRQFKCHINMEVAGTSHLFQYLFKYIHNGPDRARYRVTDPNANPDAVNEIEDFWNARYLSAGEAAWRILGFHITMKDPAVTSLPVHLTNNRANLRYHRRTDDGSLSRLERYFLRPHGSFQKDGIEISFDSLTYTDYFSTFRLAPFDPTKVDDPRYYREAPNAVNASQMHVILRAPSNPHISRIQTVRPTQGDIYYLRMILMNRPARSFEDARTTQETLFPTHQECAIAMGLFAEGSEALFAIAEAVTGLRTPRELRVLFIHLLIHNCVPAPLQIWEQFQDQLCFDFVVRNNGSDELGSDAALAEIGLYLSEYGKSLEDYGLPQPTCRMAELTHEMQRWAGREEELALYADHLTSMFNAEQRALYDSVLDAALNKRPLRVFVDGAAGTGKTTVIKALCSKLRSVKRIVLATATSASAAQLYDGGRTTHSTFKVPVNERNEMLETPISPNDARAEVIDEASLIVWDEAPMANRAVLSCVNDVLCNVSRTNTPFGGKAVVLLGDFRQTCPVIRDFFTHALIRPIRNAADPEFAHFVNTIGNGGGPNIPLDGLTIVHTTEEVVDFVFPPDILDKPHTCALRAILAPTNRQADAYNAIVLERLHSQSQTYYAADSLKEVDDTDLPPPEGVLDYPLHSLTLAHVVLKFLADQYHRANADFPSLIAASFAYHRDGVSALLLFDSELESAYRRAHDDSFSLHSTNISFRGFPVSFSHASGLALFNRAALRRAFLFARDCVFDCAYN
ncbi:hypothetical protein D9611_009568 [Ephemerocybe angulata]|uniref:ATP-dependent DNA helicase n=1 Tax=Ephemerocybe angulata TaxID=980116 RepID=A0A8H5C664_9AGAR|nr:hypothetical protein D9611_009568 [Tulosesus angulatus]